MKARALLSLLCVGLALPARAQSPSRELAARAAIHPVASAAEMNVWLARVPVTRSFPPNFAEELRGAGGAFLYSGRMASSFSCSPLVELTMGLPL